jgi:hypothetical protein
MEKLLTQSWDPRFSPDLKKATSSVIQQLKDLFGDFEELQVRLRKTAYTRMVAIGVGHMVFR